ncbi:MAG: GDP-mannose 4,6-dehydratase [Proteobacteria bacterium]|nr:GDP-mannose 4,6-dehydratase [Pseudomonadota bacterium]MBU1389504.1 GDP-mannose 4,6-dehydratase [Pseudomonadota bacterium]MBU1541324.1 GDP-mannose 4,6-dehydratase [Pseudomonadota bacterium]MBU2480561.1 GDP-mannose 4,6-dehydratase [Pseudomonadota bacterium]
MKKAFITGITGQDGSYLAELLLEKGYKVYGFVRRVALEDEQHRMSRILHVLDDIELIPGSMESYPSIYKAVSSIRPDEIYHLAAQSFVSYSFQDEFSTLQSNISGTHYLLSAVNDIVPDSRFYFAATSEMFGKVREVPQNEDSHFHPRSVYGISKVAGFDLTRNYREAYDIFACSGILYNHESPRRGYEFVTRKITSHVAMIKLGIKEKLELGNLDAKRDWGHAKDYVDAMWRMLQQEQPDDYVICSGETHSVREFCEKAFNVAGLDYRDYVITSEKFFRPAEVDILLGDHSKAEEMLGWKPTVSFDELINEMVENDLKYYNGKK